MRLNNVALCHVHKAILDKLDIKKLVLLLKWFDEWQK